VTNFNHFEKPIVHFGNAHEDKPATPVPTAPGLLHFAEGKS